jgi:hypothetical protein
MLGRSSGGRYKGKFNAQNTKGQGNCTVVTVVNAAAKIKNIRHEFGLAYVIRKSAKYARLLRRRALEFIIPGRID